MSDECLLSYESKNQVIEKRVLSVRNYRSYYARHYFPPPYKQTSYQKLEYTMDGISYMSSRMDAELITGIIIQACRSKNINFHNIKITDATAGLGGNTISFARLFKHVNAIEQDIVPYTILKKNLREYPYENITLINDDYLYVCHKLQQNVIFIDPPWGGKNYIKFTHLKLKLSGIPLEKLCQILLEHHIVVLKLPINYDFDDFKEMQVRDEKLLISIYRLKKMYIIVLMK